MALRSVQTELLKKWEDAWKAGRISEAAYRIKAYEIANQKDKYYIEPPPTIHQTIIQSGQFYRQSEQSYQQQKLGWGGWVVVGIIECSLIIALSCLFIWAEQIAVGCIFVSMVIIFLFLWNRFFGVK